VTNILKQYKTVLESVDHWFEQCILSTGEAIRCRRACTGCCRGLFDINLLDARLLQEGFSLLSPEEQQKSLELARQRLTELQQQWPDFQPPYILNRLPHEEWQQMPEDDETPCPLLSDKGLCLVYAYRPMTCRLHGLPNIDLSGESFSDAYCSLNFTDSNPLPDKRLRWHFRKTFKQEFELLGQFSEELTGTRCLELDTFIPTALLIDFNAPGWR
jgi:Fe-S-cluster containining protein